MKFVFLGAFLCSVVATAYTQHQTVNGYEGGTITLKCTDSIKNVTTTTWSGPPSTMIYFLNGVKSKKVQRGERLSVIVNSDSHAYDMKISNLNRSVDRGNYSCLAASISTQNAFYFFLEVYIGVKSVTLIPSANQSTIRENVSFQVECVANTDAFPDPTFAWYLDSKFITTTNVYRGTGNREDNKKTLECKASNNNKTEKSANTKLNIEFPPTVNTPSQRKVIEGRDLTVTCQDTPGNPSSSTFYWTKEGYPAFRQNGTTLQLPKIYRSSSGTYICTAENIYSDGENGVDSQSMEVNVFYPPTVNALPQKKIIEGRDLSVTCQAISGNPTSTTFYWTKVDNPGFTQNVQTLQLPNIKRNSSGSYICTAENNFYNGEIGTHSQTMIVNVQYPPTVNTLSQQRIIEGRDLSVTCQAISGNPTSTTFFWTKVDNPGFTQNVQTLQLPNIQRNSSGSYICTAKNNFYNGEMGTHSQTMIVNVQYSPTVNTLDQQNIIEGGDFTITCKATEGNPTFTTFFWTKKDNPGFRQNGATLQLPNIQRNSSGQYRCTAENSFDNGEKGSHSQSMDVNVLYPPTVYTLSPQNIIEGGNLTVTCQAKEGNPIFTTFYWTREINSGFKMNDATLLISNINRTSSGNYTCTAENIFNDREKGTHNKSMVVNVLYKPEIVKKNDGTEVNEHEQVTLYRQIISNPLSNVSWYNGSDLLKNQWLVRNATFNIKKVTCTDTKNYTLLANNGVKENVTDLVELIVNCKPRLYKTNFTLGVTDTTGIDFSTFVIAYPEPSIKIEYENGTESNQMMKSISRNAVNNFTIHIGQAVVNQSDFGVYHLKVGNLIGELTVIVNVIAQRKPNVPVNIEIICEETRAEVQWKSSFNGGDPQLFTAIASSGQQSNNISDKGENVIHSTYVQNLQPSTMYVFYVTAQNSHGLISSEKISCTTLAESSDRLPIIIGSAAAGGLTLVVILVVVVFLFRRYTNTDKQTRTSQRFENDLAENESVDDDGLKDNILYVSADPRENEKHEAAVYAAVNKSDPMSNNNSNVYAEVKKNGLKDVKEGAIYSDVKPKKGFFKKDGKVTKGKRQKRKQEVADVYENSDDIAMTANSDNVYSNTNHNNDSAKEQRGYKNKDGLLYVEVKFDTKTEERNPVIHGDDEKTDYATVEFPVPSSSHDRK